MAAVNTAQTILNQWIGYGPSAKDNPYGGAVRIITFYQFQLVLSTQGGATNNIPVSVLGNLATILGCSSGVYSDNSKIVPMAPSADGTLLLVGGGSSNAPQDISATVNVLVWGYDVVAASVTQGSDGSESAHNG